MSIHPSPLTTPEGADGAGTTAPPGPRSATCGTPPSPTTPITAAGKPEPTETAGEPPACDADAGAAWNASTSHEFSSTLSFFVPLGSDFTPQPNEPVYATPRPTL